MTYVIARPCVGHKDTSCYDVCPVNAIHPSPDAAGFAGAEQLYIDPTECIDCGACEAVCPHDAVYPEAELPEEWESYLKVNADFFRRPPG
ncbi:4Fe-4S binding protein [Micromonospora sp. WMMA1998]|uniref:4Fe-4S dicluster domain-containing protein n=1 Tax=Micromonospora sp. WMMA1998 TaxID=3015167 RepID=UPI00248C572E|nr:4Fe-4S binding protein [Micromonospora sp. WMMA1998]WBC14946.1 4Fe-4S binding protein [Micromonospora sp. WMMA1998]